MATASKMIRAMITSVPLEWILEAVFEVVLDTIKNPNTTRARALEKTLISFGKALASKYPGKICPTSEE